MFLYPFGKMRESLDSTDRRLAKLLSSDAQDSVNRLATKLELSSPTVRSRMRALIDKNLLKIVGLLNLSERPELISAIVGINVNALGKMEEIAQKIGGLAFVSSVSVVTGRFDLIAEVLISGDIQDLYRFTSESLPKVVEVGVITRSETFVVMKSYNKWISLPRACWD